jgi:hypothetical protein
VNWGTAIALLIALYGAGLSTYSFIVDRRDKQARLTTTATVGFQMLPTRAGPPIVLMTVANPSLLDVNVTGVGLVLPDYGRTKLIIRHLDGTTTLPFALKQGQSATFWIETKELASNLRAQGMSGNVRIQTYASDAVGHEYRSKPYLFEVDNWLKGD